MEHFHFFTERYLGISRLSYSCCISCVSCVGITSPINDCLTFCQLYAITPAVSPTEMEYFYAPSLGSELTPKASTKINESLCV